MQRFRCSGPEQCVQFGLQDLRALLQVIRQQTPRRAQLWRLLERGPLTFSPDFDVKETKEAFVFKADLPGMETKDVEVQTTDNRLTISGKRAQEQEEKTETTYRCERSFGSFTRAFTLPAGGDLEKVAAELKNGVLTVTVPKKPEAKTKQVSVKAS